VDGGHGLVVILGVDEHQQGADSLDRVEADLSAGGVLDGGLEDVQELGHLLGEVGGVLLQDGVEGEGADLAGCGVVLRDEGQQAGDDGAASVGLILGVEVERRGARQQAALGVAAIDRGVADGALQQVLAGNVLLGSRDLGPVLQDATALDGRELPDAGIVMGDGDLDEEEKRLGVRVVVLLELGGDGLDLFGVGCDGRSAGEKWKRKERRKGREDDAKEKASGGAPKKTRWLVCLASLRSRSLISCPRPSSGVARTNLARLEQLGQVVLVHGCVMLCGRKKRDNRLAREKDDKERKKARECTGVLGRRGFCGVVIFFFLWDVRHRPGTIFGGGGVVWLASPSYENLCWDPGNGGKF
jgi:hypothetical protein